MAKPKRLATLWRLPDKVWVELQPLLVPEKPPGSLGRPAGAFRKVLEGILYVLHTGCQWKAVPKEFGSGSTCRKRFQALDSITIKALLGDNDGAEPHGSRFGKAHHPEQRRRAGNRAPSGRT